MPEAPKLDTRHAHSARIYSYWLGGKDTFVADREAAEQAIAANNDPACRACGISPDDPAWPPGPRVGLVRRMCWSAAAACERPVLIAPARNTRPINGEDRCFGEDKGHYDALDPPQSTNQPQS